MNQATSQDQIPAIIQVVGDQTVQNLLPIMALHPSKIIQVRSRDTIPTTRFKDAADNLCSAVAHLKEEPGFDNYRPNISTEIIEQTSPGIENTRSVVASLLAVHQGALVNFTGATKLMSIGAYQAAAALGAPSLYCDTQEP
ncbi:MAG: hypothetical protein WCK27_26915 [Verrucomicrobiota bacterium]